MIRRPPRSTPSDTLFPYTPLFRSRLETLARAVQAGGELRFDLAHVDGQPGCESLGHEVAEPRRLMVADERLEILQCDRLARVDVFQPGAVGARTHREIVRQEHEDRRLGVHGRKTVLCSGPGPARTPGQTGETGTPRQE